MEEERQESDARSAGDWGLIKNQIPLFFFFPPKVLWKPIKILTLLLLRDVAHRRPGTNDYQILPALEKPFNTPFL